MTDKVNKEEIMQDRFKFRAFGHSSKKMISISDLSARDFYYGIFVDNRLLEHYFGKGVYTIMQCTGLKDKNGKLIYAGDIIVIPNQYPFYDYKNKEDMKQDLNSTEGEIKGESILNYIGIVEWIYSQWQYVYHCVNPKKRGISEGVNQGLNDFGFDETRNTCYEVVGNIYENPELLENK